MTYASLLVATDEGPQSDSRLELACDLAIAWNAHLIGLCVGSIAPPVYDPLTAGAMGGELLTLYRDLAEAEVTRARETFEAVTASRALAGEWRGRVGYPSESCSRDARAADLVIVGSRNPRTPYHAPDVADVLMGCGRPVLVVPPSRLRNPVGEPALIAWKDTREARRALTAALPFLRKASHVTLYAICHDEHGEAALHAELADVVTYLARHEVAAEPLVAPKLDMAVGQQILGGALTRNCGLIVAGGYGHARLREWVLGGITQDLLDTSSLCLCLAH